MAGIYYSLEQNGAKVSDESKELAQEELKTLSQINEENSGKSDYDADKLNVAMTDIKSAVADKGDKLTEDQAKTIESLSELKVDLKLALSMIEDLDKFIAKFTRRLICVSERSKL